MLQQELDEHKNTLNIEDRELKNENYMLRMIGNRTVQMQNKTEEVGFDEDIIWKMRIKY